MPGPPVEVADVIRAAGESFYKQSQQWFTWLHLKVLNAILRCRTAALGGHVDACSKCGHEAVSYNSCRNRHCPKCQANARDRWLAAREKDLLPTRYVHVVFTLRCRGNFHHSRCRTNARSMPCFSVPAPRR
jgi:predicted Zn-ribbon and HTH transcriptional regulator